MRSTASIARALLLNFVFHSTASASISLSSFMPQAVNLTQACQDVYTCEISGCKYEDFQPELDCSAACISGLASTQYNVLKACSADPQNNNNIIQSFLSNNGIQAICGDSAPAPSSDAPSSAAPSSTQEAITSQTPAKSTVPTAEKPHTTTKQESTETSTPMSTARAPSPSSAKPKPSTTPPKTDSSATPTSSPSIMTYPAAPLPTTTPQTTDTITSLTPAQASQRAAAVSLCQKGDSSEHGGGSLMDTKCSGAASSALMLAEGLFNWAGVAGLVLIGVIVLSERSPDFYGVLFLFSASDAFPSESELGSIAAAYPLGSQFCLQLDLTGLFVNLRPKPPDRINSMSSPPMPTMLLPPMLCSRICPLCASFASQKT
ncbi:hypothetical protein FH972_024672 [Carpinus fangiana]|uniref:Bifunctional inhibitor/plant lipid transfer protein/seed storage helical domain-containing protein n=1 Tax=Carpinus fangiana TaxID=176857 RepID=A0A5N6KZ27_9ROSI|nr:hypothetical protein FH972_024672 [Carpinus fangiana]